MRLFYPDSEYTDKIDLILLFTGILLKRVKSIKVNVFMIDN